VTYFLFGFMFGMFVTLLGVFLLPLPPRRRRLPPGNGGIGRGPVPLRRVPPGELVMPWQHQHLIRARGFDVPPEQSLTAQLIRYWRWRDEQVRQALEEGNNPPPGGRP
jgi:hypothetical protein